MAPIISYTVSAKNQNYEKKKKKKVNDIQDTSTRFYDEENLEFKVIARLDKFREEIQK